jgi:enoyl-CoA hydratase/carnithine racemase
VAVVVLTGAGRAFSAGNDLNEMQLRITDPDSQRRVRQPIGRQNAAWLLMSSEWIDARDAHRMGMAWKVCQPDDLLPEVRCHTKSLLPSRFRV